MDWSGRRVLVIGAARQGTALSRFLSTHGADVTVNDSRRPSQLSTAREQLADLPVGWVLGDHPLRLLEGTDLVCPSGGVPLDLPLLREARRRGIALSNDSQIFLDLASSRTIGITGSAGKSTTTSLVGAIATAAEGPFRKVWVGGNIGNPLIDDLEDIRDEDLAVLELSSFQLDLMHRSPDIAVVLNVTPNHLDRHGTMEAYTTAKANILRFQDPDGIAVLGRDDPGAAGLASLVRGRLATFGRQAADTAAAIDAHIRDQEIVLRLEGRTISVMPVGDVGLRGAHNLQNVLAAVVITAAAGFAPEAMARGVRDFKGLPHRLEFVRHWGGADWYNDSIATAPKRAAAALRAFDEKIVLLAGGRDKDLPWAPFAELISERVDHLVAFGETAEQIVSLVQAASGPGPETISNHESLEEAVIAASEVASQGDVVLLSPGGTSFDAFGDFAERGDSYKQWVFDLP
jgi:UDP-N-acetylmuramoylalanine--D-glutamate ligase